MLNHEEDANDLAQEAFTRVYRYREPYDGGKFTTCLYTISSNLARTEYRRRGPHPSVSLDAEFGQEGRTLGETLRFEGVGPREETDNAERHRAASNGSACANSLRIGHPERKIRLGKLLRDIQR
jgi:DNA-directed RNA polymerase specialized sigma24 family protein